MLKFKTKAETLFELSQVLKNGKVLPQVLFTAKQYRNDNNLPLILLREQGLIQMSLIIRSSAVNEDTESSSNAGKYLSIGNVSGEEAIQKAINKVLGEMDAHDDNQIFIQPYLSEVQVCGVAFTIDPNTGGHYYVLNYDDTTGSTSSVTDGTGDELKTYYHFKGAEYKTTLMKQIINVLCELEELYNSKTLDVEFAIYKNEVYILQVRPLVLVRELTRLYEQQTLVSKMKKKLYYDKERHPFLYGKQAIYGVMPDWNPAEMIGIRPKPLALTMYKNLITDSVWAYQRSNYGYKNLRSFPLMVDFCGLPYIDTRISFNSFLPKNLSDELSDKLIDYYTDRLIEDKTKHDKIEFEIVFSCYTFDIRERIRILSDFAFREDEIEEITKSLLSLTNLVVDNQNGLWRTDKAKINILIERHQKIMESALPVISKIYWLMEYCKRYGTLPFAGLARAGFIAVQFLNSLVAIGILSEQEKSEYMSSLETISTTISRDFATLSKRSFLEKYGHLRPGTYDICSPRYDKAPDVYFNFENEENAETTKQKEFKLSINQFSTIEDALKENEICCNVLELFDFIKSAIEGREFSKFVFTKTLSDVLELIAQLGQEYGIEREDMAYLDVSDLTVVYSTTDDLEGIVRASIARGKEKHVRACGITLPPVIVNEEDIVSFFIPENAANFITQNAVEGEVLALDDIQLDKAMLHDRILLIKSADPGYDWIFSHKIKGFITAYGGVNSHMAIRAAELNLPAVVGTGEKLFGIYQKSKMLKLDCANKKVDVIK